MSRTLLPAVFAPTLAFGNTLGAATYFIVVTGIGTDTSPSFVEAVVSAFFQRNIPVTCAVATDQREAAGAMQRSPLGAVLSAIMLREPGLFEVALELGEIPDDRRYFQMRAAADLRANATVFLGHDTDASLPIISLLHTMTDNPVDLSAYRSAGFRILLQSEDKTEMTVETVGRGQLRFSGSIALSLNDPVDTLGPQLDNVLRDGRDMMIVISLAAIAPAAEAAALEGVAAIATQVDASIGSGSVRVTRPMDYLLQVGPRPPIPRALLLAEGTTIPEVEAMRLFAKALTDANLPFSVTGATKPDWLDDSDDFCPALTGVPRTEASADSLAPACLFLTDEPSPDAVAPRLLVPVGGGAANGLRSDGQMHLAYLPWSVAGIAADRPLADLVLLVQPTDIMSQFQRDTLLRELGAPVWDGDVQLLTMGALAAYLMPPEPVLTRLWATRRRDAVDPAGMPELTNARRELLLDDARLAWQFIDRFTNPATGLCAGTVNDSAARIINRDATLWDMASQLQGIIAARSLGIIAQQEATDRAGLMLRNLPTITIDGLRLPPAMFRTSQDLRAVTTAFDICDTGRFLIALRSATLAGLVTEPEARTLRDQWDLAEMVRDGRAFNLTESGPDDVTFSHCSPYVERAFADLDLHLEQTYSPIGVTPTADDLIRLLYSAAFIGPYGTEPLLLETLEMGSTPETAFLSRVLFDAQLTWFETTGQLKAVSESPLNRPPWFLYQGLRVDRLGAEAWSIRGIGQPIESLTDDFLRAADVISAKSAYLWAAVYPHPYSDKLVELIRAKGRIENVGFSVGIFAETLMPMENYSDLNTNGIILTAIAAMLGPDVIDR